MVLDKSNVFVSDGPADADLPKAEIPTIKVAQGENVSDEKRAAQAAQVKYLRDHGYTFDVSPEGEVRITSVPKVEQEVMRFFASDSDCWFPECEQLRKEWESFVSANGGADCTDCERGKLIRQFRVRLDPIIKKFLETAAVSVPISG